MVYLLLGKLFNSVLNADFQTTYRHRRHSSDLCVVHSVIAHYRNASEMTEIMVEVAKKITVRSSFNNIQCRRDTACIHSSPDPSLFFQK